MLEISEAAKPAHAFVEQFVDDLSTIYCAHRGQCFRPDSAVLLDANDPLQELGRTRRPAGSASRTSVSAS